MNADKLIGLIGHSVHDPDFKKLSQELNLKLPILQRGDHGRTFIDKIWKKDLGFYVSLRPSHIFIS